MYVSMYVSKYVYMHACMHVCVYKYVHYIRYEYRMNPRAVCTCAYACILYSFMHMHIDVRTHMSHGV